MKTSPYTILYEDDEIITVYKQRDVFSIHTDDKKTYHYNLYHYLSLYLRKKNEKVFIVHRLDYETSGVMVFAKKEEVKKKLQKCFLDRRVDRYYEAVIKEKIPLNESYDVRLFLSDDNKRVEISNEEEGKEAITKIKSINYIQIGTALKIKIETGRRNQIRLSIHQLGFTLLGDKRYSLDENKRMYLNSYALIFPSDIGLKKNAFVTKPLWITEDIEYEKD